jgi:hypothetical protein
MKKCPECKTEMKLTHSYSDSIVSTRRTTTVYYACDECNHFEMPYNKVSYRKVDSEERAMINNAKRIAEQSRKDYYKKEAEINAKRMKGVSLISMGLPLHTSSLVMN